MKFKIPKNDVSFTQCVKNLEIVTSYTYSGISLSSKYITNLFRQHFAKIIERARPKATVIRRHGFHDDGLRLYTAIKMYKLIIRPVLEYCSQTLSYGRYSKPLNLAKTLRFCKRTRTNTNWDFEEPNILSRFKPSALVRLFCGVDLACWLEMLELSYFWKIIKDPLTRFHIK